MKSKTGWKIIGIEGLLLILFGMLSLLFTREAILFSYGFFAGGGVLLLVYLIFGRGSFQGAIAARQARLGANVATYTLVFLIILVLINFVANNRFHEWDITSAKVNTLSDQTIKVLSGLETPVNVLCFFKEMEGGELKDLLDRYDFVSDRFSYRFVDPDKNPQTVMNYQVQNYGVLIAETEGRRHQFTGTQEEDVTNALIKVTKQKKGKIYFLDGHGEKDIDSAEEDGYQAIKGGLENENYEVSKLLLAAEPDVPEDAQALVIAGPSKTLLPGEIQAVERYLDRGGRAMILADPRTESGLENLLSTYGVTLEDTAVVDQVIRLFQGATLGLDPIVDDYGYHPITEKFSERTLFSVARSLAVAQPEEKDPDVDVVELARTSESSWAETDLVKLFDQNEVALDEQDKKGPVVLAAAISAKRKTAQAEDGSEVEETTDEGSETKIVVVGDSDFAGNKHVNFYFNADFFMNSLNWLIGEESMISIRPRSYAPSVVQLTSKERAVVFYLSVFVVPQLLLMLGLGVMIRRSSS